MDVKFHGWPHILKAQQFSREWMEQVLFPLSDRMEKMSADKSCCHLLDGYEMVSLFCGESTRTRGSFEIGFQRLGGRVIFSSPMAKLLSAMGKEETIEDTVQVFNEYGTDVFVIRNDEKCELAPIALGSMVPIINAADNAEKDKQHPTQAILDLYTIYRHLGRIEGLTIAMMGDLANGRTVRSNCYLLGKFPGITIYFVSPPGPDYAIGSDIKKYLTEHGVTFCECTDIREIASQVDVFYQTRTQKNLGTKSWDRADGVNGFTVINAAVLRAAKSYAIVMHPLPCIDEIVRKEVDEDRRAIYIRSRNGKPSQVRCGLLTRMAESIIVVKPELCASLL